MSALSLPRPTTATAPRAADRGHLRLVGEAPHRGLAPSGPLQAWRRRIGALVVLAALLVLVGTALTGGTASSPEIVPASSATVVVQPGQTLWNVATDHAPAEVATGAYVDQLIELNRLDSGSVGAWQVLRLPAA